MSPFHILSHSRYRDSKKHFVIFYTKNVRIFHHKNLTLVFFYLSSVNENENLLRFKLNSGLEFRFNLYGNTLFYRTQKMQHLKGSKSVKWRNIRNLVREES